MRKYILPTMNYQAKTVILANGSFSSTSLTLSILNTCNYLVCCDGATNKLSLTNKTPDAIVGDCDSLSDENKVKYASIIHQVDEQETNDLSKAVRFCLAHNKTEITILGATGKREDHTLGNINLLCEYMHNANVEMITDYGVFNAINSGSCFESYQGQQVSLFSIDRLPLSTQNLLYEVRKQTFTNWWQATLNESTSKEFIIQTSGRTIVYRAFC